MTSIQLDVGTKIRSLRKKRGWSQEELAEKAGYHWTYIGGLERGERNATLKVIANIAKALGVAEKELFSSRGVK